MHQCNVFSGLGYKSIFSQKVFVKKSNNAMNQMTGHKVNHNTANLELLQNKYLKIGQVLNGFNEGNNYNPIKHCE